MKAWGFQLNEEKEQEPGIVGEVTGITIDTVKLRVYISRKKCDKMALALKEFIDSCVAPETNDKGKVVKAANCVRQNELDKIVGKLNNMAKIIYQRSMGAVFISSPSGK